VYQRERVRYQMSVTLAGVLSDNEKLIWSTKL